MTTTRSKAIRALLSFPVALASLLIVLAVCTVQPRFDDPDMWWHLKTGQMIWTTHSIPRFDSFSYTTHHQAYVPHEWLSQLFIFAAQNLGGNRGLMVWLCLLTSALFVGGYILCSLYAKNPKIGLLGALAIWIFSTVGLAIRPQMVGYVLLIVELLLIHLGMTRHRRYFWALPVLFAVWVNCHGSFFLGLLVGVVFAISSFATFQSGLLISQAWSPAARKTFLQMLVLSALALFCNPIGVRQLLYPLDTLFHQPIGLRLVDEWQPLQLTDTRGIALLAVLACIGLVLITRQSQILLHELLLIAMGTWLAVSHRRMLFVFGILVAPVLSRLLSDFWDGFSLETDLPIPNSILIAGSLLVVFWVFPSQGALAKQVEKLSPVKAVEYIKSNHLSGPMVNEYVFGGYLIWEAPEHPVFVDGRADVFEWTGVFAEFARWELFEDNPHALLDKYNVEFCLLGHGSSMVTVMSLLSDWQLVYQDDNAVIFKRVHAVTPANNGLTRASQ